MLPSLHRLRLHDAAPVGAHGDKHGGRKGKKDKKDKKKVHNPQRKAKHDAQVAAAAAAEAQRAKVAALIENTLDDDARLEIMKQLVGCPPYGVAMSDLEALISTDSKFAALANDDFVWKELFPALMAKRTALDLTHLGDENLLAGWIPRMDAFERSWAAREFASWWEAYTVLCHFLQLYELVQGSHTTTYPAPWWPETVMYAHHHFHTLTTPPADATVHWYISLVWTMFAEAVADVHGDDEHYRGGFTRYATHFYGGGLGDLVIALASRLTPEQLLRHFKDFDAAPLDPDLLELRRDELPVDPLGARILRERDHIFDVSDILHVRSDTRLDLGIVVGSPDFWHALSEAYGRLTFLSGADTRDRW